MTQRTHLTVQSATGVGVDLPLAGPGARSYAFCIDLLIRLLGVAAWLIAMRWLTDGLSEPRAGPAQVWLTVIPVTTFFLLYHAGFEYLWAGQTPGKRFVGVRLAGLDGRPPTLGAIAVRNVFRLADSLPGVYAVGLVTCSLTPLAQRLGDLAAGTVLVMATGEVDAADFDDRTLSASVAPRVALARELLARWQGLEPDVRLQLARRLLGAQAGPDDEAGLRERLAQIIDAGA